MTRKQIQHDTGIEKKVKTMKGIDADKNEDNESKHQKKDTILIMSGKGGVGKTTVAVNLAWSIMEKGNKTGILDADIHGPNVPKMLGHEDHKVYTEGDMMLPAEIRNNLKMISVGLMVEKKGSVIWRGPMKHNVISQFISKVKWGKLDYLIVDFPPGTGDECISAAQIMKDRICGAVIVSTPQKVSIMDSVRSIDFCRQMQIPIIGLIENMSGGIFGKGTIKEIAHENDVPFLGSIEMDEKIVRAGEEGKPFAGENFSEITEKILKSC